MQLWVLALGGIAGGAINSVVGSGTLVTYPLLLAYGLPPVTANATNSLGLAPGGLTAAVGYRRELTGRLRSLVPYLLLVVGGAVVGVGLVLALPATVFASVVPWLILGACALVVVQPLLSRALRKRQGEVDDLPRALVYPALALTGAYCGYFGAATGIILMAVLALAYDSNLQNSNAAKNLLAGSCNLVAAAIFVVSGRVELVPALVISVGATVGGIVGAPFARRLPDVWLRGLLVATGLTAAAVSFLRA